MTFYSEMAETATELLTEFGQAGQIVRTTTTGGGPSDTRGETGEPDRYDAKMCVFDIGNDRVDGTNIIAGDFQVIVEAISTEILASDIIKCSTGTLRIVDTGKISPAGEIVAYDMVCRK